MADTETPVIYWDASAVIAAMFPEPRSEEAIGVLRQSGVHLMTGLAWTEVCAVVARAAHAPSAAFTASEVLSRIETGPWDRIDVAPDWKYIVPLALKWRLRGADLWHLASAKTLAGLFPELTVLTFDQALNLASEGEGLISQGIG